MEREREREREREGTAGSQQQMVSGFLPAELSLSSLLSLSLSALLPHVLSCIARRIMYHLTSASLVMYGVYAICRLTCNQSTFCWQGLVNLILVIHVVVLFEQDVK